MEVKPGYKQTEVGVIPNDWGIKPMREFGEFAKGIGLLKEDIRSSGRIPGIPYTALYTDFSEVINYDQIKWFVDDTAKTYLVCEPCVLIASSSNMAANTGKACALTGTASVAIGREVIIFKTPENCRFLSYLLSSPTYRKQTLTLARGTTIKHLYPATFQNYKIALPSPSEQTAIAEALSDVDGLLSGLDRLIAKKRHLKQAAMQQLLTGQTRLPGFHGEWEETTFGSVVRHHAGNSTLIKGKLPSSEATGRFPAYSASGQDVWCDHFEYEGDAIVVSAVGSRCGKAFRASGKWCAIANTHVVWPNSAKIDARFLAYFINDEGFWQKSGTGQPFVLFTKTFIRPLRLPKLPEQTAIAEVLADMDAELAALEQRWEKTRALKQAMMQELLTGRTRLISHKEAHA